jgi:uncharacterized protein YlxP (DUF503 family)
MYLPVPDEAIWVGVIRMVIHIPGARTLKDRRRAVHSLVDRIKARHHCAAADVGHLENAGAAVISAAVVGNEARHVRSRLDAVRGEADRFGDAYLAEVTLWVQRMGEPGADPIA